MSLVITSVKVFPFNPEKASKTKAFASVTLNDGAINFNQLTVVQGKDGVFLGLPNKKIKEASQDTEAKYQEFFFFNKDTRDMISKAVVEEYEKVKHT